MDKKLKPIKQRVLDFIENQSIKKEDFYKKTLLASANFKGEGLKSEMGGEKLAKILIAYPALNARWLMTGEGEMLEVEKTTMLIGADIEPAKIAIDTLKQQNGDLKDEVTELHRKLVRCMEEKEKIIDQGFKKLTLSEPTAEKTK